MLAMLSSGSIRRGPAMLEMRNTPAAPAIASANPATDNVRYRVTARAEAAGTQRNREVDRELRSPGTFATVWYDLPLNGEWSDLTATFGLERTSAATSGGRSS